MKVCLIDADSKIPNLALMKLSSYYKKKNYTVDLVCANLPYYPNKKKKIFTAPLGYDLYFCSCVFSGNKDFILGEGIKFGGTGCDLQTCLTDEIDQIEPDYSIYPDNNTSYGFISRGCIRNCNFCVVPEKEGTIRQVSNVESIVKHSKVKFLDNNFLSLSNHKDILEELIKKNIKCQFNQGLDIRLITDDNSKLLSKLNYLGEYIFAFDTFKYLPILEKKLPLMSWRKPWQLKFFVYCHPDMALEDIIKRIEWLRKEKCLPYVMRHIDCWESKLNPFYIDLAAYANQPNIFKKMSFAEFLRRRHPKKNDRVIVNINLYYSNM